MKHDRDILLDTGAHLAIKRLSGQMVIIPFGLGLQPDGEVICIESENSNVDSEDALSAIYSHLRMLAKQTAIKAAAAVSDVTLHDMLVKQSGDAIRVEIDDCDTSPVTCYIPYALVGDDVETEEVIAVGGGPQMFD